MTRRPRIARLLHRFAAWLLADSLAAWATITQDDVDAGVDAWAEHNPWKE